MKVPCSLASLHLKKGAIPIRKSSEPTIHFQGRNLLGSGRITNGKQEMIPPNQTPIFIPGSYMCALFPPLPSKAKIQVVQTEKGRCKQKRSLQEDLDRFPLPEFMAYQSWPNRFNIDTLNLNVFITSPLTSQNDIHLILSYLIMEPIPTHLFIHPEQLPFRHMVMANDRRWGASAGEHSPKRIPLMHWRRYRL